MNLRMAYHRSRNSRTAGLEPADSPGVWGAAYRLRMITSDRQQSIGHSRVGRVLGPSPQPVRFGASTELPTCTIRWRQDGMSVTLWATWELSRWPNGRTVRCGVGDEAR